MSANLSLETIKKECLDDILERVSIATRVDCSSSSILKMLNQNTFNSAIVSKRVSIPDLSRDSYSANNIEMLTGDKELTCSSYIEVVVLQQNCTTVLSIQTQHQ